MRVLPLFFIVIILFTLPLPSQPPLRDLKICSHNSEGCRLLNQWYVEGTAAGNLGDYYDNRDRGHSSLILSHYPQLTAIAYTPEEMHQKVDWAGQRTIIPFITIGNSSTSGGVKREGSNVRALYYTREQGLRFLYSQYRSSNLYIYPEHRDHDFGHNGHPGYGDLFPTNSPYVIISQGSSGSDRPFMNAFVHTLAAFRPEVKATLAKTGMLIPTLQMIFRLCNKNLASADEYLTGKAHPTVFIGDHVDTLKMIKMAHEITLRDIPPMVQLRVIDETFDQIDPRYFNVNRTEKLGDTPNVIARIMRGPEYTKSITISAKDSVDINFKPLTYHWKILRGDPDLIQITPHHGGTTAEITVSYHERRPISPGSKLASNRVDIGVFVHNGTHCSAPAFITIYTLDNERRTYDEQGRLIEIDFHAADIGFKISNWQTFFEFLNSKQENIATTLLRSAFTTEELSIFSENGQTLRPAYAIYLEKLRIHEQTSVKYHRIRQKRETNKRTLEQAKQTEKLKPSFETNQLTIMAQSEYASAIKNETQIKKEVQKTKKQLKETQKVVDEILDQPHDKLAKLSIRECLRTKINNILNDPNFYADNIKQIDQWLLTHGLKKFQRQNKRVQRLKIDKDKKLTNTEKYELKKLNHIILTQLFYSEFLEGWEERNFVDPRLSKPHPQRYQYQYDSEGKLLTRACP